ncbi:type III PLP-dependent enzyme [Micromonospora echinospora]|uniref:type III PLP-dependent enzyme n=1 Tax=Micromonospora echinospora TaxID=1877 RepID=UPI003414FA00
MSTVEPLLQRYGSPLYVYRLERVDEALTDLRAALPETSTIYYSLKANPHPAIVRRLHGSGCRAEISSPGELAAMIEAGVPGGSCLYTGPAKTDSELLTAMEAGVRRFSVESVTDLQRVGKAASRLGTTADCIVRVNGAVAGASGLRMTGAATQFGIDVAEIPALKSQLHQVPGTRLVGTHFFPLSNARDEHSLLAEFRASIDTAAGLCMPMSVVDLGGGFAAPYARPGERPRYADLRQGLESALDEKLPSWRSGGVEVAFESGRYLTGDCGTLVCTATELKRVKDRTFVLLDAGINHLGGMAGLGRLLRPQATPTPASGAASTAATPVTIVGPLCTPADVLGHNVPVGLLDTGSRVTFPNVGAYGLTASLVGFLSRSAPAEVVLDHDTVVSASRLELVRAELTP